MLIKKPMMNRTELSSNLKAESEWFKVILRPPKDQIFYRNKKKQILFRQITQKIFRKFSKNDAELRKKLNWKQWHFQTSLIIEILKICLNLRKTSTKICWSKKKSTKLTHQIIFKRFKLKLKILKEHFCWNGSSMSTENSN